MELSNIWEVLPPNTARARATASLLGPPRIDFRGAETLELLQNEVICYPRSAWLAASPFVSSSATAGAIGTAGLPAFY